jgi:hypothetical protein
MNGSLGNIFIDKTGIEDANIEASPCFNEEQSSWSPDLLDPPKEFMEVSFFVEILSAFAAPASPNTSPGWSIKWNPFNGENCLLFRRIGTLNFVIPDDTEKLKV